MMAGRWVGKLLPNAESLIEAHLTRLIGASVDVAADILDENIALHFVSGRQWKNLPEPSSGGGEFPQEQSGTLRSSIKFLHVKRTRWHVGFVGLNEEYLKHLEFAPASEGGRAPLSITMLDGTTQAQMMAAIEQSSKL